MRRKSVVPAVTTRAKTSAMTCVHVTIAPKSSKRWVDVGSWSTRTNAPPAGARQAMTPSRMRARPSVPIIFTSGSRLANAGPSTIP